MSKALSIYALASAARYNASVYYRVVLPLWTMHKLKLPVQVMLDSHSADMRHEDRYTQMMTSDIHWMYQTTAADMAYLIDQSRTWEYQYDEAGDKLGPPSFVMDTDDDLFNVHPLNPAFEKLGYKDHNGNELKDGQKIWIRNPVTNAPELMWEDGNNVNYALNKKSLDDYRNILNRAELITVSTQGVKNYVTRECAPEVEKRIHILPNCIDLAEYPKVELAEHPDEVRILWQGSPTHWEDWWHLKEPLGRVAKKYPHAKFIIWGVTYEWIAQFIPANQVLYLPWMDYRQYKMMLSIIGHDINLAPLSPTTFNLSRSAIKFYESSAIWNPAATLAQTTGAYGDEVIEGETGLLFASPEEFETKLSALIEDAMLRKRLASNAKDWVKTHRDPTNHALTLYDKLCEVRDSVS